jgi:predicted lipid-binding transport protein (Tim44 family)
MSPKTPRPLRKTTSGGRVLGGLALGLGVGLVGVVAFFLHWFTPLENRSWARRVVNISKPPPPPGDVREVEKGQAARSLRRSAEVPAKGPRQSRGLRRHFHRTFKLRCRR